MKTIGVLALQGAINEHILKINLLDAKAIAVKHPSQLTQIDGLIIPGGESTAMSRLIEKDHFYGSIKQFANEGKAIFGTCAGLILCGKTVTSSHPSNRIITPLALIDIISERNGFGRQGDSFETILSVKGIAPDIPAVFIRAPYIKSVGKQVDVLACFNNHIVMARWQNILVTSFHPELTHDNRILSYFLSMIK